MTEDEFVAKAIGILELYDIYGVILTTKLLMETTGSIAIEDVESKELRRSILDDFHKLQKREGMTQQVYLDSISIEAAFSAPPLIQRLSTLC